MKKYRRIFVIVLDSLGIGAMPDAERFGDSGVDTLGHILDQMGTLDIPNLKMLGMLNLHSGGQMEGADCPRGRYLRLAEASNGKDTMTGHWEMMGILTERPFLTFTDTGFPPELIEELEARCGKRVIGNKSARPYVGKHKGEFKRTSNRHDYALKPTGPTALNALKDAGYDVIGVGKINDIFCGEGITETHRSNSSVHGMEQTIEICRRDFQGLCFVNLVDFDALWGHRRDVAGYAGELERFDKNLGLLLDALGEEDLLLLTADHGNDPTYTGTDHTREYVPLIAYARGMKHGGPLAQEDCFGVIGATVAENFGVQMPEGTIGRSILEKLG